MRVKDVMNSEPFILQEEETILSASKLMKKEKVRNLPVVDEENKLTGLITLREIIETVFTNPSKILVKDAMIKQVTAVQLDTPLKGAIEVMLVNKFGCLPVIDNEKKLLGIVTESDLLKKLYEVTEMPEDFFKIDKKMAETKAENT